MAKAKAKSAKVLSPASNKGKWGAVDSALDQIREKFGEGSIMKISGTEKLNVEATPTGSISLDLALGVGGIPKGRIIEIYGPESSGKTTLTLHMIAEVQKKGGLAAFIDAEHAMDPEYAKKIGVSLEDLLVSQPDSGEQALDITETLVRSNALDLIIVDSVAALTPRAEIEGEMGASHMGLQARLMSQALRKLTGIISKSNTTVIFINQIRMKIGVMFGNPETTTGGNALKFYASVRIEVRRSAQIKNGDKIIGNRTKAKVVKNKVAPPFKVAEFDIMYNEGISAAGDILDTGLLLDVVKKSGNSYSFNDIKFGVGRETAKTFLKSNPDVFSQVDAALREKVAAGDIVVPNSLSAGSDETDETEEED
jgi:recombination protein RecA